MGKESLRDRAAKIRENTRSHLTPAQEQMRQDMAELHDAALAKSPDPLKLSAVFDEVMVQQATDPSITQAAWEIINEAGTGLQLNMKQWALVQRMIELGIIAGRAGS